MQESGKGMRPMQSPRTWHVAKRRVRDGPGRVAKQSRQTLAESLAALEAISGKPKDI